MAPTQGLFADGPGATPAPTIRQPQASLKIELMLHLIEQQARTTAALQSIARHVADVSKSTSSCTQLLLDIRDGISSLVRASAKVVSHFNSVVALLAAQQRAASTQLCLQHGRRVMQLTLLLAGAWMGPAAVRRACSRPKSCWHGVMAAVTAVVMGGGQASSTSSLAGTLWCTTRRAGTFTCGWLLVACWMLCCWRSGMGATQAAPAAATAATADPGMQLALMLMPMGTPAALVQVLLQVGVYEAALGATAMSLMGGMASCVVWLVLWEGWLACCLLASTPQHEGQQHGRQQQHARRQEAGHVYDKKATYHAATATAAASALGSDSGIGASYGRRWRASRQWVLLLSSQLLLPLMNGLSPLLQHASSRQQHSGWLSGTSLCWSAACLLPLMLTGAQLLSRRQRHLHALRAGWTRLTSRRAH